MEVFGRMWRSTLCALAVLGALAAPAQATVRKGTGTDPAGDAAAANDIVAVAAQADDASGAVVIGVGLAASPASWVVGLIGTRSGDSCGPPSALLRGRPSTGVAQYARDTASGFSLAQMRVD